MPISYKHKIYTTLGTPTDLSGDVVSATDSVGVPAKDYTVKGKTIVWNQLLDKSKYPATTTTNGVTFTNNGDGSITVDGTASSTANGSITIAENLSVIQGHKYYATMSKPIEHNNFWLGLWASPAPQPFQRALVILDQNGQILTCVASSDKLHVDITLYKTTSVSNATVKPQFFDLTEMFGAGNEPATPEEFRAMFPDDYYPYNAGELKSIAPTSVEASGVERFQLLDKSKFWKTTTVGGVTFTNNRDGIITVNGTGSLNDVYYELAPPAAKSGHKYMSYGCPTGGSGNTYDIVNTIYKSGRYSGSFSDMGNGVISRALEEGETFTSNIFIAEGYTANNLVFKPQLFDLTEMFGFGNEPATVAEFWQRVPEKLYGYNPNDYKSANIPSSKYFPDGMKSAGSVYDEINFLSQKAIKRIGVQNDISTFPWQYGGTNWWAFRVSRVTDLSWKPFSEILCAKYEWKGATTDATMSTDIPNGLYCSSDPNAEWINIKDSNYSTSAAFLSSLKDVPIYYELATPVETVITPPLQALSTFKGFTSFSAPNSLTQNGPMAVTYYAEGGANPESGWLTSYKRKLYMGRTIEWNQLLDKSKYPATTTTSGVTFTNNGDGTITVNGTATANAIFAPIDLSNPTPIVSGHKFLFISCPSGGSLNTYYSDLKNVPGDESFYDVGEGVIMVTTSTTTTGLRFNIRVISGYTANNLVFKPQLFDLTQMFGAGNEPTTPEEFWSYFDHKLYPYNPGETQPLFKISRKSQWGGVT